MSNLNKEYFAPRGLFVHNLNDNFNYKRKNDPKAVTEPYVWETNIMHTIKGCSNSGQVRFLILSDIHGNWNVVEILKTMDLENVNAIIYAGDIINHDERAVPQIIKSLIAFRQLGSLVPTFVIAGNHDSWTLNYTKSELLSLFAPANYIENECFTFENIRFFGTPMTAAESNEKVGNFMRYNPTRLNPFGNIPSDVEVIISHGGPTGMQTYQNIQYGDPHLRRLIETSDKLKACVFGHMHNDAGFRILNNVVCLNAAQMVGPTFKYRPFILVFEK